MKKKITKPVAETQELSEEDLKKINGGNGGCGCETNCTWDRIID